MSFAISPYPKEWRKTLLLLLCLFAWLGFWYGETASAMIDIWMRSETYAHAFVVPPISLWLIWRNRKNLLLEKPEASLLLAIPLGITTFLWLLGELTAVNALTQFALVGTLVLSIMALLGYRASKQIAFPLAFLFFSVPIGDFMMPKLMDWTAAFTVSALRASSIPVYQEGLQFVIPSGNWSVVEACSGIRYIIASVTVGTLFAYLNYFSLKRRLIFIAVSVLVPLVANWLRAYMIVMLGHLSGNKLAAGVDHLIYGWIFFGIVIMIMFMIGARWSEAEASTEKNSSLGKPPSNGKSFATLAAGAILLVTVAGPLWFAAIEHTDRVSEPKLLAFDSPPEWTAAESFASWKPDYANPSDEFHRTYEKGGQKIGLYIGYYRNQNYERKLITSTNVLANTTNKVWSVISQGKSAVSIAQVPETLRTAILVGKDTSPEMRIKVWHWYWINGKFTTSEPEAKLLTALSRLSGHGDDSAVIMIFAPYDQPDDSLSAFLADSSTAIQNLLFETRALR